MPRMPVLFIGHGSPINAIERNRFSEGWRKLADSLPTPALILCVSAHWYEDASEVSGAESPGTIHDFYGFPPALYSVSYPAPGAPSLAGHAAALLGDASVNPARGLDHGAWSVLRSMYPKANIPVCQLSVHAGNSPRQDYAIGQALRPLRSQGVLLIGSGNIVHNLARMRWGMEGGYDWADAFDLYIRRAILERRHDAVIEYEQHPASGQAFTTREHYDPLLYALGATLPDEPVHVFNEERVLGSVSMTSYAFGL